MDDGNKRIRLFVGPANSGKSDRVLARIAEAFADKAGVMLVAPSTCAAGVMLRRLEKKLPLRSINSPKQVVVTFPNLYTAILNTAGRELAWLNAVERDLFVGRVISDLREEGKLAYFIETAGEAGPVNALAAFSEWLLRSGGTPSTFLRF